MVLLLLSLVATSSVSPAEARKLLEEAKALNKRSSFEDAIPKLKLILYPPSVKGKQLESARIELARAYFYGGQVELARNELRLLFRRSPRSMANGSLAPDFLAFFAVCKEELALGAKQTKAATTVILNTSQEAATVPTTITPSSQPVSPAPVVVVVNTEVPPPASAPIKVTQSVGFVPAPWYLKWIPLGIGHFLNRDYAAGAAFVSLEVAFAAVNIALLVVNDRLALPDGRFPNGTSPATFILQQASAGALYVTMIMELLDALLWSDARVQASHSGVTLRPGPNGFVVRY